LIHDEARRIIVCAAQMRGFTRALLMMRCAVRSIMMTMPLPRYARARVDARARSVAPRLINDDARERCAPRVAQRYPITRHDMREWQESSKRYHHHTA